MTQSPPSPPDENGSWLLGTMVSVPAGLCFLLLFSDVTRLVLATTAVERSVRVGVRCLSTSDSTCYPVQASLEDTFALREAYTLIAREFSRTFPDANFSCSTPGCLEIEARDRSDSTVVLEATIHLPLTFPLSTILGVLSYPIRVEESIHRQEGFR